MADHKHEWQLHSRLLDEDGDPIAVETCSCGEKRERKMNDDEAAEYEAWRAEMVELDRVGAAVVVDGDGQ